MDHFVTNILLKFGVLTLIYAKAMHEKKDSKSWSKLDFGHKCTTISQKKKIDKERG